MEAMPVQAAYPPPGYYMPGYGMRGIAATMTPQLSPTSANGIYAAPPHMQHSTANAIYPMTPQASPTSANAIYAASTQVSPTTANGIHPSYYPYGLGQVAYNPYYYPPYAVQYAYVNGVSAVNSEPSSGPAVETPMDPGQHLEGNGEYQS